MSGTARDRLISLGFGLFGSAFFVEGCRNLFKIYECVSAVEIKSLDEIQGNVNKRVKIRGFLDSPEARKFYDILLQATKEDNDGTVESFIKDKLEGFVGSKNMEYFQNLELLAHSTIHLTLPNPYLSQVLPSNVNAFLFPTIRSIPEWRVSKLELHFPKQDDAGRMIPNLSDEATIKVAVSDGKNFLDRFRSYQFTFFDDRKGDLPVRNDFNFLTEYNLNQFLGNEAIWLPKASRVTVIGTLQAGKFDGEKYKFQLNRPSQLGISIYFHSDAWFIFKRTIEGFTQCSLGMLLLGVSMLISPRNGK